MIRTLTEKEIEISGEKKIYGTLARPASAYTDEKFPAVLMISGSGPLDRNGNGPKGKYQLNVYKELAEYITKLGFITFRYDKRGTGKSEGDWISTGMWDLVDDAELAFKFLQNHPQVDRDKIIVAGHSEGTIIGTALSERQELNGLMLLSGGVGNLHEFTTYQRMLTYQELKNSKGIKGLLMRLLINEEKAETKTQKQTKKIIESNKDVYKILFFFKQPAKWIREHFAYNPRVGLKKVTYPVIAIHGDKDGLVDPSLLEELSSLVKGPSETHIIKDMEHGFRFQYEQKSMVNVKKMLKVLPSRPLNPDSLGVIESWLTKYFKADVSSDIKENA
ncbi:alpha/beta fold hydrolase [Fictibacillus sp. UD]|uniref:alpha/beta hydrolase family protein n=1 Tax=Fictibacillus sp. UD TaxID=3038777 RepID=UPI003746BD39